MRPLGAVPHVLRPLPAGAWAGTAAPPFHHDIRSRRPDPVGDEA